MAPPKVVMEELVFGASLQRPKAVVDVPSVLGPVYVKSAIVLLEGIVKVLPEVTSVLKSIE